MGDESSDGINYLTPYTYMRGLTPIGRNIYQNPITGQYYTSDGSDSVMTAGINVLGLQKDENAGKVGEQSWWQRFWTPLGGANTKSAGEITLNSLSGLAGLIGNIYATNKQVGVMDKQIKSNENIARSNYASTISDAAYNRNNYANIVQGWGNQQFTNQVAQNNLNSFNSLTQSANNLGISGDPLAAQKQQAKSMMG